MPSRLARLLPVVLLAILVSQASSAPQTKDKPVDPDHAAKMSKGTELFKSSLRAILQTKCLKCHSGERLEGEFDMGTREALIKGGSRGPAVVPHDHKKSLLWQLTAHQKEPHMPHERAKLADADMSRKRSRIAGQRTGSSNKMSRWKIATTMRGTRITRDIAKRPGVSCFTMKL
jgi:hypothetical protein